MLFRSGPIHVRSGEFTLICFEPADDLIVLLVFRAGIQKFLIPLMLMDHVQHTLVRSIIAIKYFSLPVQDEFLQVKGYGFRDTEILGLLRN